MEVKRNINAGFDETSFITMLKGTFLVILFFMMSGICCYSRGNQSSVISVSIHFPSATSYDVNFRVVDMLNGESSSIASSKLDSFGQCTVRFEYSKQTFVTLKIGEEATLNLFVEPGSNLKVDFGDKVHFSGVGADVNNYLIEVDRIFNSIRGTGNKDLQGMQPSEFSIRLAALSDSVAKFHEHFLNQIKLPINTIVLLKKRNDVKVLEEREAYQWNYELAHDFDIPKDLDVTDQIPFDSVLLESGMYEYSRVISIYMDLRRRILLRRLLDSQKKDIMTIAPVAFMKEFQKSNHSTYMKHFLELKNVDYFMDYVGISPLIDSLYKSLEAKKKSFPKISSLEKHYNKLSSLIKGHIAPTINGVTKLGDTLALDNFKGKVIYVDIWASWCVPCVQEIPFSQKLQALYEKNPNVVFLNTSVDSNKNAWEKALSKYENWGGTHILNDRSIYSRYSFNSIPKYMLIDREGKIVSVDAPRPSSGLVDEEIEKLLSK